MFGWKEFEAKHKQMEVERNPQAQQLIREAMAAHKRERPFYHKLLAAFGRCLMAWGDTLERHFDAARNIPLEVSHLVRDQADCNDALI
jgi:hypothetical protein